MRQRLGSAAVSLCSRERERVLFESLLTRADDYTLQQLLGRPAVKLIRVLSSEAMSMDLLRRALLSLHSPADLLVERESRGQLIELLKPDEARTLTELLGVNGPDPYRTLTEMQVRRASQRERDLLSFFGVPVPSRQEEGRPPKAEPTVPAYPLFAHQRRALREVQGYLSQHPRRVVLHMPTGAGKTRVAMNAIAEHLRMNEPSLVVWLAYSEELCDQAADEFLSTWGALGDRETNIYRFWGSHDFEVGAARDGLVVAGLAKLFSAAKGSIAFIDALRLKTSLVVMDEAHQSVADTYSTLLDVLLASPDTTALLGLTATPGRTWNEPSEDEKLAKYFARQKVTLRVPGYDNPLEYLIDEGYLARPTFEPVLYQPGSEITLEDVAAIERHFDIPDRIVRKLEGDEQRNLAVLRKVEELVKRHKRILVFAASVEHSNLLAAVLRARGVEAASITGTTPAEERATLIAAFRSDSPDVRVLCNYGVLTTGFDAPKTSAAVIARPTRSLVLYSQMVGRAIRGPRAGGNAVAEVFTIQDPHLPGFGSIADAFVNWEDVWSHA